MKEGYSTDANMGVCTKIDHSGCLLVTLAHLVLYFYAMTMWPDRHFRDKRG